MNRRRRHHPVVLMLMVLAALLAFELAVDALRYAAFLVLPVAGWFACRWWDRRHGHPLTASPSPLRLVQGLAGSADPRLVDDLRRQVAKLEDDAARREQLVDDLEDVAARPIEAIIASYRLRQQQYGPAAVGKPGRRP